MESKPLIKVQYFPPRIINGIECPGGYEAIVCNIHQVEFNFTSGAMRHEMAEDALKEILDSNGWDEHKCEITIQRI